MKINLPSAIFNHIEINKENFITKLEVSDTLDSQGVGTWFNNDNIKDMLELVVIKSKTEEMRELLSCSTAAPTVADPSLSFSKALPILIYYMRKKNLPLNKTDIDNLYSRVRDNTHVVKRSLNHDFLGSKEEIINSEIEDGQTKVYYDFEFPFSRTDNDILDGTKPGDLDISVFAYVKVNNERVQEDLNFSFRKGECYYGTISSEKIISNNEFQNTSFVYRTDDNNVFFGEVEDSGEGSYAGILTSGQRVSLSKEGIKNYKIMNNRDKIALKSFKINFNHTPYKVVKTSKVTNDDLFNNQKPVYFSELYHTKNKSDNVVATFSINKEELLARNTLYGPLFSSMSNLKKQEMVEKCRFKNITIKRVRIADISGRVSGINTTKEEYAKLDKNEPDVLLLSLGETTAGVFPEINNEKIYFSEENVFITNPAFGVKSYTFEDKDFRNITDGMYQYHIEVEITDPLIGFLTEKLTSYNEEVSKLSEYYHFASSDKTYYNSNKKRFASKFGSLAREKFDNNPESYPWVSAPAKYIDTLTEFAPTISSTQKNKFLQGVSNVISPDTGNPDEINTLLKLMESASNRLSEMSGLSIKPSISHTAGAQTKTSNQSSKKNGIKTHREEYRFSAVVDSENKRNFGYDFLDLGSTTPGIKKITQESYEERVEEETLKFFQTAEETIKFRRGMINRSIDFSLEDKKLSFLTPSSFINGNIVSPLPLEDREDYKDLQSLVSTNGEVGTVSARTEFSSNLFSVTVGTEDEQANEQNRIEENHTQKEVTGTETKINNFFEIIERTLNGTINPFIDTITTAQVVANLEKIKELPNQIKAVILNDGDNNQDIQSEALSSMQQNYTSFGSVLYQLMYGQLVRVQYLSGYTKNSDGNTMIKSPVWRELDNIALSSAPGQELLCRLVYYKSDDDLFPIEKNELFDINVYDSLFYISISPAAGLAIQTPDGGFGDFTPEDDVDIETTQDGLSDDTTSDSSSGSSQDTNNAESKNRCILLDNERANLGAAYQAAQSNIVINQDPSVDFDPTEVGYE